LRFEERGRENCDALGNGLGRGEASRRPGAPPSPRVVPPTKQPRRRFRKAIDDPLKELAIHIELVRLAQTHPSAYGAKKQMYHHLQTKFGLKRSQLSKLLSGFDPWKFKKDLEEFLKNVR